MNLRDMFSEIAAKDSQWLQEYVIDMLDEDDEEWLTIIRQATQDAAKPKPKPSRQVSTPASSIDEASDSAALSTLSSTPSERTEIVRNDMTKSDETLIDTTVTKDIDPDPVLETKTFTQSKEKKLSSSEHLLDRKSKIKREALQTDRNATVVKDVPTMSHATKEILPTNNEAKNASEEITSKRKAPSSEHLLDRKSNTLKRDDSSKDVVVNQQSTGATLDLNTLQNQVSTVKEREILGAEPAASFDDVNQTTMNRKEPLPAVPLPNITNSFKRTRNVSPDEDTTNKTASIRTETKANDEKVVVFSDSRLKKKQRVVLSKLVSLGYSAEEILSLDPDALSLIVEDNLRRPSTGVPVTWKSDKQLIKIESPENLNRQRSSSTETETPAADPKPRLNTISSYAEMTKSTKEPLISGRQDRGDELATETSRVNGEARVKPKKEVDRANAADAGTSVKEERQRRVFTGRPEPGPPRDDPPPPKAFWPDIDTFRSLLRKEAAMRLSILGDDWSQTVKDESEWRLNLYKNWLWTLHTGVGDPLIESRSDRMRRSRRDQAKSQSKTKGTPSNKERQRRQRDD
ncbi:hypothetical protein FisN_25Lh126 [Fistulifera solaris]|uniref:Uncharacterized protein n=1 Tax=Fistulifera solaris TaxID=1519565 RepID=A0A1Z5J7P9_FISSO|nr:hypothetical protein FisN_25Lh126 [Fistulifera solaris]|eukprot:GAX10025.1 hypothetical protein FisN_25Lh126 [Fistulifera solaris]